MTTKKIIAQKELIAREKQRLERKESLIKEKQKTLKTRKLISLGILILKAGVADLDTAILFGALLDIKELAKDEKNVKKWKECNPVDFKGF